MIGFHLSVRNSIRVVSSKLLSFDGESYWGNEPFCFSLSKSCFRRITIFCSFLWVFSFEPFGYLQILICELSWANERSFTQNNHKANTFLMMYLRSLEKYSCHLQNTDFGGYIRTWYWTTIFKRRGPTLKNITQKL